MDLSSSRDMSRTIAIIASLDTKEAEVFYCRQMIQRLGHKTLIIDVGAHDCTSIVPDIHAREVARAAGKDWWDLYSIPKHEMLAGLAQGLKQMVPKIINEGRLDAILSFGGVQNTMMAAEVMRCLPVGFPKLIVSTIASGSRTFDSIVGTKDIVLIPSVADIAGLNLVTTAILSNAVASVVGMVQYSGKSIKASEEVIVGATLMGVTNDGVVNAIKEVEKAGYQVISFHTTGVGGRSLEEFLSDGTIKAVMDMTLHEITASFYPASFSYGATNRLETAIRMGIPLVVVPGGIDFIDFNFNSIPFDMSGRKFVPHNSEIAHIKLYKEEIIRSGEVVIERLNRSSGPVTMVIPTLGFRQYAEPGGQLWDPDVDETFIRMMKDNLKQSIKIVELEANINEQLFSARVASEMLALLEIMKKRQDHSR